MNDLKPKEILPPELIELTDQIGLFIEYWGFKKIHGQIWSHIFLSPTPLDATTLVKRLDVSKALVSLAIKDLVQYDVIQVVGQGEKRTILFQSNPNLIGVITSVLRMRERKMLSQIMSSWKNLTKANEQDAEQTTVNPEALEELGEMIDTAEQMLDLLIKSQMSFLPLSENKTS